MKMVQKTVLIPNRQRDLLRALGVAHGKSASELVRGFMFKALQDTRSDAAPQDDGSWVRQTLLLTPRQDARLRRVADGRKQAQSDVLRACITRGLAAMPPARAFAKRRKK